VARPETIAYYAPKESSSSDLSPLVEPIFPEAFHYALTL
jgi:hypothetical protein